MESFDSKSDGEYIQTFKSMMERNMTASIDDQTELFNELRDQEYDYWRKTGILEKIKGQIPKGHELAAISLQANLWPRHSIDPDIAGAYFRIRTSNDREPDGVSSTSTVTVFEIDDHGIVRPSDTFNGEDAHTIATQLERRQALRQQGFLPNLSRQDFSSIEEDS